jgi:hypothetical protein
MGRERRRGGRWSETGRERREVERNRNEEKGMEWKRKGENGGELEQEGREGRWSRTERERKEVELNRKEETEVECKQEELSEGGLVVQ